MISFFFFLVKEKGVDVSSHCSRFSTVLTLLKTVELYQTSWLKRKRIVMDAVDQIAEGMEKKRKDVLVCALHCLSWYLSLTCISQDLCSIETDESVGIASVPNLSNQLIKIIIVLSRKYQSNQSCIMLLFSPISKTKTKKKQNKE